MAVLLASSGERRRVLLNIPQHTGQPPTTKNYPAPMPTEPRLRSPVSETRDKQSPPKTFPEKLVGGGRAPRTWEEAGDSGGSWSELGLRGQVQWSGKLCECREELQDLGSVRGRGTAWAKAWILPGRLVLFKCKKRERGEEAGAGGSGGPRKEHRGGHDALSQDLPASVLCALHLQGVPRKGRSRRKNERVSSPASEIYEARWYRTVSDKSCTRESLFISFDLSRSFLAMRTDFPDVCLHWVYGPLFRKGSPGSTVGGDTVAAMLLG